MFCCNFARGIGLLEGDPNTGDVMVEGSAIGTYLIDKINEAKVITRETFSEEEWDIMRDLSMEQVPSLNGKKNYRLNFSQRIFLFIQPTKAHFIMYLFKQKNLWVDDLMTHYDFNREAFDLTFRNYDTFNSSPAKVVPSKNSKYSIDIFKSVKGTRMIAAKDVLGEYTGEPFVNRHIY